MGGGQKGEVGGWVGRQGRLRARLRKVNRVFPLHLLPRGLVSHQVPWGPPGHLKRERASSGEGPSGPYLAMEGGERATPLPHTSLSLSLPPPLSRRKTNASSLI